VLANINQQVFKANSKYMLDYRNLQQHTNSVSTTTTASGTLDTLEDMEYQANYLKQQYMLDAANQPNVSNAYMSHLANTTHTESTINDSEFYSTRYNFNEFSCPSANVRESDVIDVGQILKARNNANSDVNVNGNTYLASLQQVSQFDDSDDMMVPVDFKAKRMTCYDSQTDPSSDEAMFTHNYIQQFHNRIHEVQVNHCFDPDSGMKRNQSLSLFWPNKVAECDTSCIDGSLLFSPTNAQSNLEAAIPTVAQEVNVNQLSRNLHPNNSYNSNTASNSTSYSSKFFKCSQ
jgi:hypothetical protein